MQQNSAKDWLELKRDADTGIETIRAGLNEHVYAPHWHDEYLIGITDQGAQQFNCRSEKQILLPGSCFLLEPGEIHDGEAIHQNGSRYRQLYLPPSLLKLQITSLFEDSPDKFELGIDVNSTSESSVANSISDAFSAIHYQEPKIVKDACLDNMLQHMTKNLSWRKKQKSYSQQYRLAFLVQEYLHANINCDIGLTDVTTAIAVDRYRLTRAFKSIFGIAPHAYLIQLRLAKARVLLAKNISPVDVASELCFSDQSHLGRWFKRCYLLSPAHYQQRTNLPDLIF